MFAQPRATNDRGRAEGPARRGLERTAVGAACFLKKSANRKLAPTVLVPTRVRPRPTPTAPFVCSSYVSIETTCPDTCAFKGGGCYVRSGFTATMSRNLDDVARHYSVDEVIREEVRLIDGAFPLPKGVPQDGARGGRDLRLHVGGDIRTRNHARWLGSAADRYRERGGGLVWSFTHAWRDVPRVEWGYAVSVLASVERPEEIESAREHGYAAAIVLNQFPSTKAFTLPGTTARIIPCPAETVGRTCVECRLCLDAGKLFERNFAIAFEAHGPGVKKVREALVQLRRSKHGAELPPPPTKPKRSKRGRPHSDRWENKGANR